MASTISVPDQLISRICEAAKKRGFAKTEDFCGSPY